MLNPIASLGVYLAEMVICYFFFSDIFERRTTSLKCLVIGSVIFSAGSALNLLFNNNSMINSLTTFVIIFLFSFSSFHTSLLQSFFHTAILFIVNVVPELFIIAVSSFITGANFLDYNHNILLFIFEAISSKTMYFIAVLLILRVINPKGTTARIPINFLIYPLAATFCTFVFWYICVKPECSHEVQLLLSISSISLFVSFILLFASYSYQVKIDNETTQMKSELSRLQTEQSYYQILEQQNQQLMIYAHDAKKHLDAIQAINDDPRIGTYVQNLSKQLRDYTRNGHSGNRLLDIMIQKYTVDCEMRGIQFEYDVKVCNLSHLDDADLVTILGNLLDNAVTAAEKSQAKTVLLNTVHRNSYSVIIISNSCDESPKQSGDHLVSTKSDACFHGFGLRSVSKALKKYHGDFLWEYDNTSRTFTVTAMLNENALMQADVSIIRH